MAKRDLGKPFSVQVVGASDDARHMLRNLLDLYSDEPVTGQVLSQRVEVVPGVHRRVDFVCLWRTT